METLTMAARWLAKQYVVTWCVHHEGELRCVNTFYPFDAQEIVFYVLAEEKTWHVQMSGPYIPIVGTVNGQPRTVALIHSIQFKREIRRLERQESETARKVYNRRFPAVRTLSTPVQRIRLGEARFTDNTLGFGKKMHWLHDLQLEQ